MKNQSNEYAKLKQLPGFPFPVYFSPGLDEQQIGKTARRCERAWRFLNDTFQMTARIGVVVLAPEHWAEYATFPVYGMPHFLDAHTLVIAGENNDMWRSLVPPLEILPPPVAEMMRKSYQQPDGSINVASFFDLLAVHELGHLYHYQTQRLFPRLWLMELFCNLCLHAYVAVWEPEQLLVLETLPQVLVGMDSAQLPYRLLADFERLYADMPPQNFGWFQGQLHVGAKRVYEAGGLEALQRLWQIPSKLDSSTSDEELARALREKVHPELERILVSWPVSE